MQRMMAALVATVVCAAAGVARADELATVRGEDAFAEFLLPAFQQSCVKCHGESGNVKGEVNLFELQHARDLAAKPELVRDIIEVLDSQYMPPEDEPPLAGKQRAALIAQLQQFLRRAVAAQNELPRTPIRRMNRFQYNNAVQDLFQLNVVVFPLPERMLREHGNYFQPQTGKMPEKLRAGSRPLGKSQMIESRLAGVTPFPQDLRAEHGFDNRGDHLSLSPLLLEAFLRQRAFRRPVEEELLDRYAQHVLERIRAGDSFTDSMKAAAATAIASPRFFYLYDQLAAEETETGEGSGGLDDFDLASRLSFFLWGSIPDQTLLDLAAEGQLHEPKVLTRQVERMLQDRRLKRFCDSFPAQWLQLERIISSAPDPQRYPQFYFSKYRASMHMMLEPLLLFETVLIEDQSILQFIDSDFSYRSNLLEAWYRHGSQGNAGSPVVVEFRRVPVTDRRQGGLITNAAVMTMTSGASRTKPITRGAWVASVILNDPPEPPPADVPPLADKPATDEQDLTLRERFAAHRQQANCAGCHRRIDPLGFALENYDAAGIWREKYENGRTVDAGGTLFGRHEFTDVVAFKDALLAEKDRFTRALASHLLSFAAGREFAVADSLALDQIVRETAAADYRFQTLIKQIVLSEPFRR